ncbi:MAG: nuclear transport factor 2 family protein, partial [Sinobacteraceae bacterium]|nr:nuclear transport factor 2 family protein [Nevskiaceae bacterium]
VLALEDEWLEADKQHNPERAASLLADSYMSTSPAGKLESRSKVLADISDRHYTTGEYEDMRAAAYGNTAIVRGIFKGSGTEKDGKAFKEQLRFTDTWIKLNGDKWSCVATQYTTVP